MLFRDQSNADVGVIETVEVQVKGSNNGFEGEKSIVG